MFFILVFVLTVFAIILRHYKKNHPKSRVTSKLNKVSKILGWIIIMYFICIVYLFNKHIFTHGL